MTTVSAPGKAILFGEHAIVYPAPWMPDTKPHTAVAGAINKRVYVTAEKSGNNYTDVESVGYEPFKIYEYEAEKMWKDFKNIFEENLILTGLIN